MNDFIHIRVKFPGGMSARDKQIILEAFQKHYENHDFETKEHAYSAFRGFVCEQFPWLGSTMNRPKTHRP